MKKNVKIPNLAISTRHLKVPKRQAGEANRSKIGFSEQGAEEENKDEDEDEDEERYEL